MGNTYTREQIYQMVWEKPLLHLSKELGISDRGLARACKRHNIPTPGIGYWRRLECGKESVKEELSKITEARLELVELCGHGNNTECANKAKLEMKPYENLRPIVVPETIHKYHPLVSSALKSIREDKIKDQCGRLSPRYGNIDIRTYKETLIRAGRIMTTLINAIEELGFKVQVSDGSTYAYINNQKVKFHLWEKTKRVQNLNYDKDRWGYSRVNKWDFLPSERLSIHIESSTNRYSRKTWEDNPKGLLEDKLNDVITGLIQCSIALRENKEKWDRWHQAWEEEQKARRREAILQEDFVEMAEAFERKRKLESFLNYVTHTNFELPYDDIPKDEWVVWAKNYLEHYKIFHA